MAAIRKFQVNIDELSEKEKLVLDKLMQACELIAFLYEKQKNPQHKGANFYPPDLSKKEIAMAAEKNPHILHPYTFVEKDKQGRLRPVPFCVKFKKELRPISKLIGEAARIAENKEFKQYLVDMARALLKNDYARNEILWITNGPFKINFIIGPVERYLDRLFFKKCAYHAWIGITDRLRSREAEEFKNIILASRRKIVVDTTKFELPKLRIEINKTICFAGQKADLMPTGSNLPNDPVLMKEHGSKLTIFSTSLDYRFKKDQLPIFETIFHKVLQDKYSIEELYEGSLRCILLHEISHSLIRYQDAEQRLNNLFPVFDEILAYVLGIRACGPLLLKGAITQKELEAILIMHICRNLNWWIDAEKNPTARDYALGAAIAMNFFLEEGSIKEKHGFCVPDFNKLFISIDHLSRVLEYYLSTGSYQEAEKFVNEYASFDIFKKFSLQLKKIGK